MLENKMENSTGVQVNAPVEALNVNTYGVQMSCERDFDLHCGAGFSIGEQQDDDEAPKAEAFPKDAVITEAQ